MDEDTSILHRDRLGLQNIFFKYFMKRMAINMFITNRIRTLSCTILV